MKKIIICTALIMLFFTPGISAYCNNNNKTETRINDISLYEQRLKEFNKEHGTNYVIPEKTANGENAENFYISMTLNEFDEYIMSIYDGSIYNTDDETLEGTFGTLDSESSYELNDISVYEEYLEQFNNEHDSYFIFPSDERSQNIIQSMTLEEFGRYIMSLYDGSYYDTEKASIRYEGLEMGYITGSEENAAEEYNNSYMEMNDIN